MAYKMAQSLSVRILMVKLVLMSSDCEFLTEKSNRLTSSPLHSTPILKINFKSLILSWEA